MDIFNENILLCEIVSEFFFLVLICFLQSQIIILKQIVDVQLILNVIIFESS